MKQIANGITVGRIIMSLLMLATAPFSDAFYGLAAFCGISDMIDGPVARKTESAGKIGAMLDSIADLIFTILIVLKCLPVIRLERWMWIWMIAIAVIKLTNLLSGLLFQKRIVVLHTIANKITGLLAFLALLSVNVISLQWSVPIVCASATISAVQEGHFILTDRL